MEGQSTLKETAPTHHKRSRPLLLLTLLLSLTGCDPAAPIDKPVRDKTEFLVKPYLVYPSDKPAYPAYETAVKDYVVEMQGWYRKQVGKTFTLAPLKVVRGPYSYLRMRCGENPSQSCIEDPKRVDGNWGMHMNKAIHGGVERWEENTVALVFGAGGGGDAGSNVYDNHAGFALVGDWALEGISGVENTWGIPCRYSDGWQCEGNVPRGTPAHEIGHAFGLPHPGKQYKGRTIMEWHGDYPDAGLLDQEIKQLRSSPFFREDPSRPAEKKKP